MIFVDLFLLKVLTKCSMQAHFADFQRVIISEKEKTQK